MKRDEQDIKLTINPVQTEEPAVQDDPVLDPSQAQEAEEANPLDALVPEPKEQTEAPEEKKETAEEKPSSADETDGAAEDEADEESSAAEEPSGPSVPTIEEIIREESKGGEVVSPINFSLSKVLGGQLIATVFQRQVKLVLLITFFLIIYITCRYQCQQQMVEIYQLEQKLTSVRYKATVYSSILTEKSRESNILEMLSQRGDSTLLIPTEPPYKINVPE